MSPHSTTPPAGNQGHRTETTISDTRDNSLPENSPLGPDNNRLPQAPITKISLSRNGETRLVVIKCPYCKKRHTHGWPFGARTPGIRVAHCRTTTVTTTTSYQLTTQGGEPRGN